jgi:hypothetical protein
MVEEEVPTVAAIEDDSSMWLPFGGEMTGDAGSVIFTGAKPHDPRRCLDGDPLQPTVVQIHVKDIRAFRLRLPQFLHNVEFSRRWARWRGLGI